MALGTFGMHALVALAEEAAAPSAMEERRRFVSWLLLLYGASGIIITVIVAYLIVNHMQRRLVEVVHFLAESGIMLEDSAKDGTSDLPKLISAQAQALMFMAEDLHVFVEGKSARGKLNPDKPGLHGDPRSIAAGDVIPLGEDDF